MRGKNARMVVLQHRSLVLGVGMAKTNGKDSQQRDPRCRKHKL